MRLEGAMCIHCGMFFEPGEKHACATDEDVKRYGEGQQELNDEAIEWLRTRPESVKELAIRFPPACLVRATRPLQCPRNVGLIVSYTEDGQISVVEWTPDDCGRIKHFCRADWLRVASYNRDVTPERIRTILGGKQ